MTTNPRPFKVRRIQALLLDRDHAGALVVGNLSVFVMGAVWPIDSEIISLNAWLGNAIRKADTFTACHAPQ